MAENDAIRVLIVDDHAVVRSGLAAFFTTFPDLTLVGEAENGEEAVVRCRILKPDVVLMDLIMPGMGGVTAIKQITSENPEVKIIALTSYQEDDLIQGALSAGASGYLMKNITARELASAIRSAYHGKMTLSPEAAQSLINAKLQVKKSEDLSEREREVLKLMVEGLSNSEIAEHLVVSISTVKYHASNIFDKLGVENRVSAVTMAIQKKMI